MAAKDRGRLQKGEDPLHSLGEPKSKKPLRFGLPQDQGLQEGPAQGLLLHSFQAPLQSPHPEEAGGHLQDSPGPFKAALLPVGHEDAFPRLEGQVPLSLPWLPGVLRRHRSGKAQHLSPGGYPGQGEARGLMEDLKEGPLRKLQEKVQKPR